VGLADALVHEPELIILDEPTIGFDPNQIRAVRQLIKDLGRKHTVLLSSHILPEVEMTCSRVVILREGRVVAADTTDNLQKHLFDGGQVIAEIAAPAAALRDCWEHLPEVEWFDIAVIDGEYHRCGLKPRAGVDLRPLVYEMARKHGWMLRELTRRRHTLEDIFVRITRPPGEEEA
jgi:ABC-2 type transport system ATP-binding protein